MKINEKKRSARKTAAVTAGVLAAALLLFVTLSYAAEPGTSGDPIALKSYVDAKLTALETKLSALISPAAGAASGSAAGADSAALAAKVDELTKKVDQLSADNAALRRGIRQSAAASAAANTAGALAASETGGGAVGEAGGAVDPYLFAVYEIKADERVLMGASTELIIRTGRALAIRGESGAVIDLNTGADLEAGANVPQNHLLLSSRDDSRGVRFTEDAWVLIKGPFTLR